MTIKTKTMILSYEKKEYDPEVPPNLIDNSFGVGTNENAEAELIALDLNEFDYPKPSSLIDYLLKFNGKNNGVILDFFAGSGTTLDALMQLNKKDNGCRIGIICTNNQNGIAENICYERNKRKITGYTSTLSHITESLVNNNLRYYKACFIPSERTEVNRRKLTQESTDLLCIKEDCYNNVSKEYFLNEKEAKLFTNGLGKFMLVVYHSRNQMEVVEKLTGIIPTIETTEKIKLYAFSPEKETIEADFLSVADKIEAVPLPDSIYNAYRATFRTLKLDNKQAKPVYEPTTEQE
jgi:adenine-specific DNA-methyltransferase